MLPVTAQDIRTLAHYGTLVAKTKQLVSQCLWCGLHFAFFLLRARRCERRRSEFCGQIVLGDCEV